MTARERLNQIRILAERIENDKLQIVGLETSISGLRAIDYSDVKVQSSPHDSLTDGIARLIELKDSVINDIVRLEELKEEIKEEIEALRASRSVPQHTADLYAEILTKRYVFCKDWDTIAKEMRYSRSRVCHLHGWALREFENQHTIAMQ